MEGIGGGVSQWLVAGLLIVVAGASAAGAIGSSEIEGDPASVPESPVALSSHGYVRADPSSDGPPASPLSHTGWVVSRGAQPALPSQAIESVSSFSVNGYAIAGGGGSIYVTRDGMSSWAGVRMASNNPMHGVDFTPNGKGWAVGDNGLLMVSNDFGLNWRQQNSTLNSGLLAVKAVDDTTGYAVGQWGKIMTTSDGGSTWVTSHSNASDTYRTVYFHNRSLGWVGGNAGKLVRTTNAGLTWAETIVGTATIQGLDFLDDRNGAVVAANGDIFTTADGGASWSLRTSGFSGFIYDIDVVNNTHAYAVGAGGRFFFSVNSWITWTIKTAGTQDLHSLSFPTSSDGLLTGAASSLQRTTDGGTTFSPLTIAAGPAINLLEMVDRNNTYALGDTGFGAKTSDGGGTWTKLALPNALNCLAADFIDANTGWVAQSGNHVINTTNGGTSWTDQTLAFTFNSIHFFSAQNGIAVTTAGVVYKTVDGGVVWTQNATGLPSNPFGMYWVDANTGFVGGTGAIQKTVDGGTNWVAVQHNLTASHNVRGIAPVRGTTNMVAVGTTGGLGFTSTSIDSGNSFVFTSPAGVPQVWGVAGPSDKAVFISTDSGQIHRSNDKGVSWVSPPQNSTVSANLRGGVAFFNDTSGFAAGQFGVILATANGGIEDKTPPTVASTSPSAGAIDVPTTSPVSLTFSEAMDRPSVEGAWRIGPFLTGTFSWIGNTVTWQSSTQFAELTNYEVKILTDARDLDGNRFAAEFKFNFTTKKFVPPVAPKATFPSPPSPQEGAVNVATDVKIRVSWTAPMNHSSVESAWTITPAAVGPFNWSGDSRSFVWQANPVLQEGVKYTIAIGPAAKDAIGNASGATFSLSFTTMSTSVPPQVASTSPMDNSTGVAKDANIVVKFDRKMRPIDTEQAFRFNPTIPVFFQSWNSPDDDEVTWTHTAPLWQNTRYTVTILRDAKDVNGVKLPAQYSFNFTTLKDPDFDPPKVNCNTPQWAPPDPVPLVKGDAVTMQVNFTDEMDQVSVEAAISVSPQATIGAKNWDLRKPQEPRLFFPVTGLQPGTEYSVKFSTAAKDDAGNSLTSDAKCPFKTEGTPPGQSTGGVDPLLLGVIALIAIGAIGGIVGVLFMKSKKRAQEEAERPKGWWEKGGPMTQDQGGPVSGSEPQLPSQYEESSGYQDPYNQEGGGPQGYNQERMAAQEQGWQEQRRSEPQRQAAPPAEETTPEGWGFPGESGGSGGGSGPGGAAAGPSVPGGCRNCGAVSDPGDKFCQGCGTAI